MTPYLPSPVLKRWYKFLLRECHLLAKFCSFLMEIPKHQNHYDWKRKQNKNPKKQTNKKNNKQECKSVTCTYQWWLFSFLVVAFICMFLSGSQSPFYPLFFDKDIFFFLLELLSSLTLLCLLNNKQERKLMGNNSSGTERAREKKIFKSCVSLEYGKLGRKGSLARVLW